MPQSKTDEIFASARWYDTGINWDARLTREIPFLREVLGPPDNADLLDAACGPGRHVVAMTEAGYRVTGVDRSPEMLAIAQEHIEAAGCDARLIHAAFEDIPHEIGPFDGVYCLGNSLAATADPAGAERAAAALATALCEGGKLVIQLLNFQKLRHETPKVRGPRVRREGDREYISTRVYAFHGNTVEITNVTLWNDDGWRQHTHAGTLYAIEEDELSGWLADAGLTVINRFGAYDRSPFDPAESNDLIIVATRQ